jgi:hypothetical protein
MPSPLIAIEQEFRGLETVNNRTTSKAQRAEQSDLVLPFALFTIPKRSAGAAFASKEAPGRSAKPKRPVEPM